MESVREEEKVAAAAAEAAARRFLSLVFQWFLTSLSVRRSSLDAMSDHLRVRPVGHAGQETKTKDVLDSLYLLASVLAVE
jgi:hypothetical protein